MPDIIEQLTRELNSGNPHIIADKALPIQNWKAAGRPHVWVLMESTGIFQVYADVGYGNLALFKNGEFVQRGINSITTPEVVILDKDYYGTVKYIWK